LKNRPNYTLIDLSRPIIDNMSVYPGDEQLRLEKINDFSRDGFNNFRLTGGMHIGTHIDGPMHMTKSDCFIDDISLYQFVGNGCLLNATGMGIISITPEFKSSIASGSIVLVYTGFGKQYGNEEYYKNHPVISMDLARYLVRLQTKMVCLDIPSPDKFPYDVHKFFLKNSVLIAENLTGMEKLLTIEKFEIIALPILLHTDSSPARIIARILE
jgi:kynurenine formamidase